MKYFETIKSLTAEMVGIESVVKGGNETATSKYVFEFLSQLDYFKERPDQLILQKTKNDEYDRHSTIALLKGNGTSNKTIVMMGHIDTVDVDDYGILKPLAFKPDELKAAFKNRKLDPSTKADLESGEYMFGRGVLDMKSGVAGHMAIMKCFSENLDELDGNLVLIAECDEEDGSRGIISALDILNEWKKVHDLDYVLAINADYSTNYYQGDPNRYVYLGSIGKLLPAVFVAGKETHVGQAYGGFDPNLLIAQITKDISYNTDLSDTAQGETTIPPMSLKQADLKEVYTVQTALYAYAYYNFFTHAMSPKDVLDKLKEVIKGSNKKIVDYLNDSYKKWCKMANFTFTELDWNTEIYTWKEFCDKLREENKDFDAKLAEYKEKLNKEEPLIDLRIFSLKVVKHIFETFYKEHVPTVILYYSSVFSQNIEMSGKDEKQKAAIDALYEARDFVKDISDAPIQVKYFYPYIADSSFMYLPDDEEGIKAYEDNMACWGPKFIHPFDKTKEISMPVINIGTYGKDGHKFTERVHMKHTFEVVPQMSEFVIRKLIGK
ncbi:MAG: M20/M25/M40 family metallo-hydrolase [Tissierellia bacterium]|nr:M20/M25/M40 family metallo-hydrolase [Tissierellia bacterium]